MPASWRGRSRPTQPTIVGALTDPATARKAGFDSVTLFSMFIPDTYEFYWTVSPAQFIERMRREYDRFWTPQRDAKRQRSGLSRLEVMTLASIVYEETRQSDEMPRIAGVYINRLRKGWPLQADPTVKIRLAGVRTAAHPAPAPEISVAL
ncbi:endolytic transglycosylase MltG [Alistipes communis]|uniref:endolytic transglycosylase MltG n=1 Tax=Alistipes communis TaxID=2585118 RepID=UPI003C6C2E63